MYINVYKIHIYIHLYLNEESPRTTLRCGTASKREFPFWPRRSDRSNPPIRRPSRIGGRTKSHLKLISTPNGGHLGAIFVAASVYGRSGRSVSFLQSGRENKRFSSRATAGRLRRSLGFSSSEADESIRRDTPGQRERDWEGAGREARVPRNESTRERPQGEHVPSSNTVAFRTSRFQFCQLNVPSFIARPMITNGQWPCFCVDRSVSSFRGRPPSVDVAGTERRPPCVAGLGLIIINSELDFYYVRLFRTRSVCPTPR